MSNRDAQVPRLTNAGSCQGGNQLSSWEELAQQLHTPRESTAIEATGRDKATIPAEVWANQVVCVF